MTDAEGETRRSIRTRRDAAAAPAAAAGDRVTISSSGRRIAAITIKAIVVAIAAGAGALATAAVGDQGLQPQQYYSALAAAAAAVGGVLGINEKTADAEAPPGELQKMRSKSIDVVETNRQESPNGHYQEPNSRGASSDQQRHE